MSELRHRRRIPWPPNLRFDDTNPAKEYPEYVEAIKDDVRWLGFEWGELRHASDCFEVFYRSALKLVEDGKAYVGDLDAEQMREYRGTLTEPGRNSPFRDILDQIFKNSHSHDQSFCRINNERTSSSHLTMQ